MKNLSLLIALLSLSALCSAAPVISGLSSKATFGRVDISYDLRAQGETRVTLVVSDNGGKTYDIFPSGAKGDLGNGITPGSNKEISWFPSLDKVKLDNQIRIKLVATDLRVQRLVEIGGGTFFNGVDSVSVSGFLMDQFEITQREFLEVMNSNPSYFRSVANAPVESVSWFDAIEYCNRRSLFEGLQPVYSFANQGTNPGTWPEGWNLDFNNHVKISWDQAANGYRLPTEMEWMWAAKGGIKARGVKYSGSKKIDSVAWFEKNSDARTHTVGTKISNELKIWDLSGNVMEWVWDIFGSYPKAKQRDPLGAANGTNRVLRGGSYNRPALYAEISHRESENPTMAADHIGFRVCRNLAPEQTLKPE